MPTAHKHAGKLGGLKSWANTVDRAARTAPGRAKAPSSIDYWLDRLGPKFDDATDEQRLAAADAAKRAHFAELSMLAAKARRDSKATKSSSSSTRAQN